MQGAWAMDEPVVAAAAGDHRDESPSQPADAEILKQIANGDLSRFDDLVDRYKTRLFRHIHRRIRDPHRAEDLTQEIFLRLFRAARAGAYTGQARVVTWLFTIPGNCVTDHLRGEARHQPSPAFAIDATRPIPDPRLLAERRESEAHVCRL